MRTDGKRRRLMRSVAFSLAFALLVLGGAFSQEPSGEASRVPPLPRIVPETFPPALREMVKRAYEEAVAHPQDPSANGQLGMILQAYQHGDERAGICYRRAHSLDQVSFRWAYYLALVQSEEGHYAEAVLTLQEALRLYEKNKYDVPDGGDRLQAELNAIYTDPGLLLGLGVEYGKQGKLQEA